METKRTNLDYFRQRSEAFVEEIALEGYRAGAGLSDGSDFEGVYRRYEGLASVALFHELRDELWAQRGDEKRRLEYLVSFVARVLEGAQTKDLLDRKSALEASATVELPWGQESYRLSAVLMQNEADRVRRLTIARARHKVAADETPIVREMFARAYAFSRMLGFKDYTAAVEELHRLKLLKVRETMAAFLRETESVYVEAMAKALKERLSIGLAEAERSDLAHLFRAPVFDTLFPAERLVAAAEETVRDLGLDIYAHGHITFDTERRPKKSPRAFCAALKVPQRVVLVTMPTGGQSDYRSFLHELGHALHFGYADPALAFEFRWLGDNSVTEAFAFLLEHLLHNPRWLERYLGVNDPDEYLAFAALQHCAMLRRYAAKIAYELVLHDETDTRAKDSAYVELLSAATHVAYAREEYLIDVDPHYYAARYLRAWIFAASFTEHLERRFGTEWFRNPKAGSLLRDLWRTGQQHRIEDLEQLLDLPHLDPAPLVKAIRARLAVR